MLAALGGLLWGQEKPATNQLYGDTRSTEVPKPPSITDTQKAAAWKAQAIFLLAEAELKATAQYKEWENAQANSPRQVRRSARRASWRSGRKRTSRAWRSLHP